MANSELALSVVIYSPPKSDVIRLPLHYLCKQTVRERIELIIVHPEDEVLEIDEDVLNCFGAHQITTIERHHIDTARVAGLRHAHAPIVAFVEDHVLVARDWAERLLIAHEGPYAAVAGVMYPANQTIWSWASFLTSFIHWLGPNTSREMGSLPQHNTTYKRDILASYDDETLYELMLTEWRLHQDLQKRGYKTILDSTVSLEHINISKLRPLFVEHFAFLRLYAHKRGQDWPLWRRLLYAAGSPIIPFLRMKSILQAVRQSRTDAWGKILLALPLVVLLLLTAMIGEAIGYVAGPGNSEILFGDLETNRLRNVSERERQELLQRIR